MLKDESVWKRIGSAEQRFFSWNLVHKKGIYELCEKGQATQEYYKDVMRLCREKIKRGKAQIELHSATFVKDN